MMKNRLFIESASLGLAAVKIAYRAFNVAWSNIAVRIENLGMR
jgi:hypothetical protein